MEATLAGRSVLITGANRGLGRALVEEALQRGAERVYAASRGRGEPFAARDERVIPLILDVTDDAQIQRAAEEVDSLGMLINNAGFATADDLSDRAVLERHLQVNLLGPWNMAHAFIPHLKDSHGAIINILSLASAVAHPLIPSYSVSKAAALSLTQSLRALLAPDGIRVHAVLAGPMDTEMTRGFPMAKASTESVAHAIFEGVDRGEEDLFPDPDSATLADGWRNGALKARERQNATLVAAKPVTA